MNIIRTKKLHSGNLIILNIQDTCGKLVNQLCFGCVMFSEGEIISRRELVHRLEHAKQYNNPQRHDKAISQWHIE